MVLGVQEVTLAIIIGTLAAIVYSLRVLVLMERRISRMDENIERITKRVAAEELKIEAEEKIAGIEEELEKLEQKLGDSVSKKSSAEAREARLSEIRKCRQKRVYEFSKDLRKFHKKTKIGIENVHNLKFSAAIEIWNGYLKMFEEQTSQLVKTLEKFIRKTSQ